MNTAIWEGEDNNMKMMGRPYGTLRVERKGGGRKGEEFMLDYGEEYWESDERREMLERLWRGQQG